MEDVLPREATELQNPSQAHATGRPRASVPPWNELSVWQRCSYRLRAFWGRHVVIGVSHEQSRDHFGRHVPRAHLSCCAFSLNLSSPFLFLSSLRYIASICFHMFLRSASQLMLLEMTCIPTSRSSNHPRFGFMLLYVWA